jgi:hypothetical protein
MTAHVTGTVVNGALQLDTPLALPKHSRVTVHVEPLPAESAEPSDAFAAFCQLIKDRPLRLDGQRPTREDLYDRR